MTDNNPEKVKGKKRLFVVFSVILVAALALFLTYYVGIRFKKIASSGVEFRDFIQSYGYFGVFVALGIQFLQVFIALIPGEFVEIGMGYAYGWIGGTVLCLLGVSLASFLIFALTKKYGIKLVEIFVSHDKINEMKIINSEEKLRRFTFIVYLIPGTPKDLLTYFIGLTRISVRDFLAITLFARIPSIVTSVVGGNLIGEGHYIKAVVLFVITVAVSLLGMKIYKIIMERIKKKSENTKKLIKNIVKKGNKDKV